MATVPQIDALSDETIELRDLRHFSAQQLRPLLQQEAAIWEQQLRWDYGSSIELLLQYLDSRMLPGYVVMMRGQIRGYAFCVYEGNKAVVGDVYASRDAGTPDGLAEYLMNHLLDLLMASPEIERIESQLLLFRPGELAEPFRRSGFVRFPRLYQECELATGRFSAASVPAAFELGLWNPAVYQAVAELIHACYAGHLDAQINNQYRTLDGSLRFLHNIVRFPGCGVFDPRASLVLRDRRTQALAGVILCSRIAGDVAHITQLCVAPKHRGRGLGRMLLHRTLHELSGLGYRAITLTVSEQNAEAVKLYREAGFVTRHRFDAMVLDKRRTRFSLGGLR